MSDQKRKFAEALAAFESPMRTFVVETEDEIGTAVEEMEAKGFKFACMSNAGLPKPKVRLTFLPASAFKSKDGAA